MRHLILGLALVLATGANAQSPPAQPQHEAPSPPFDGPGGMHTPPGLRPEGPGRFQRPPPPPQKAASFRMRNGGVMIDVKCADDEPTKACMEAASQLIDKLSSIPERAAR